MNLDGALSALNMDTSKGFCVCNSVMNLIGALAALNMDTNTEPSKLGSNIHHEIANLDNAKLEFTTG